MSTSMQFADLMKAQLLMNQRDNMLFGFVVIFVIDLLGNFLREFGAVLKNWITLYVSNKFKKIETQLQPFVAQEYELLIERNYEKPGNWDLADSVLQKALKGMETQKILIIGDLEVIKNGNPFEIDKDLFFQMKEVREVESEVKYVKFRLFSRTIVARDIRTWVGKIKEEFLVGKKNNFGNKLYFFDQFTEKQREFQRKLLFTSHLFVTNRTLHNIFHEKQKEVISRVEFFMNNKDWYNARGIPHTLGLLLKGEPGTGKTSTIKAIANITQRHIVNINLGCIKSKKQLKKLFYDERLDVCQTTENPGQTTEYIIPIDKRVYVIEDIDALKEGFLLKREYNDLTPVTKIELEGVSNGLQFTNDIVEESDVDLSTILNIMDGTLETPGRILIITSNFPEKLDDALIRPGRIDLILDFKKANHKVIRDMFLSFYGKEVPFEMLSNVEEYRWTPAEISQILFRNFDDMENSLVELRGSTVI